jgi:hypothetical protein
MGRGWKELRGSEIDSKECELTEKSPRPGGCSYLLIVKSPKKDFYLVKNFNKI